MTPSSADERAPHLLPCPFCGGTAEFTPYKRDGLTLKCGTLGCVQFDQRTRHSVDWLRDWLRDRMIDHWNTRASLGAAQVPVLSIKKSEWEVLSPEAQAKLLAITGAGTRNLQRSQAAADIARVPLCRQPPEGWTCSRGEGHEGPCASSPAGAAQVPSLSDERDEAESAYIALAFNYVEAPIGSRDWDLFWHGWKVRALLDAAQTQETSALTAEVLRLRDLAATCYAGLGAECDLPEVWLDALLAASEGQDFSTNQLLPICAAEAAPLSDSELLNLAVDFRSEREHCMQRYTEFDEIGFARAVIAALSQPSQQEKA
jgi:hypothetical protein